MHISWAWPCTSEQPGNLGLALVGGAHQSVFNPVFCDGWGRVPPCRLAWGGPVLELAVPVAGYGPVQEWWWPPPRGLGPALLDSQDRSCQCPDPAAGHCGPTPSPELPKRSQASLPQSLAGSWFLSPGFSCACGFVCVLQQSLFPRPMEVLQSNPAELQIPRGFPFPLPDPQVGSLLWGLGLAQQCELFGIVDLQFVARPPGGSMVGLTAPSSKRASAAHRAAQDCCHQCPCPRGRPPLTRPPQETLRLLQSGPGSWGGHHSFPWLPLCPPRVCQIGGLILNVVAPLLPFVLGHGASFSGGFQDPPFDGCPAASCHLVFSQEMSAHPLLHHLSLQLAYIFSQFSRTFHFVNSFLCCAKAF